MKGYCLVAVLGVVLLSGCESAKERAECGNTVGHLRVVVAIIDLQSQRLIYGPMVPRQLIDVDGSTGGWGSWCKTPGFVTETYREIGDLDAGQVRFSVIRISQEALELDCSVELTEKDVKRSDRTTDRLRMQDGEKCTVALPRDGKPRILVVFGVVNLGNLGGNLGTQY